MESIYFRDMREGRGNDYVAKKENYRKYDRPADRRRGFPASA
jgi:hypothetical protein